MKEQISIDNDFINKVIDIVGMGNIAWDIVEPMEICQAVIDVYLESNEEIKRLKRLDENRKELIKEIELELHEDEKYCNCTIIDLLKSLDK